MSDASDLKGIKARKVKNLFSVLAVMIIGLLFSAFVGILFFKIETKAVQTAFHDAVYREIHLLDKAIQVNREALFVLKGLYEGSADVTRSEFKHVAKSILRRHSNIQALEWVPHVTHTELEKYVSEARLIFPEFEITEKNEEGMLVKAKEREDYYFVYFLEPYERNEPALGFDNASNPTRLKNIELSRDSGELFATGRVDLVQLKEEQGGYLLYIPIYEGTPTTVNKRRENFLGFIVAVFKVEHIFEGSLKEGIFENMSIRFIDVTNANNNQDFYSRNLPADEIANEKFMIQEKVPAVAGREWILEALPSKKFVSEHRSFAPYILFLLGSIFSCLCALFLGIVFKRESEIEKLVENRTLELTQAKKELELLASVDSLTGLANRRFFDKYFDREWLRAIRDENAISLIVIDIDYFKQYNDFYGHAKGDSCLKQIASLLKGCIRRPADMIARFGGEEFVLLLPNTKDPLTVAKICLEDVLSLKIPHEASSISDFVTVSFGVATVFPTIDQEKQSLFLKADAALYKAKKNGRNRIEVSGA